MRPPLARTRTVLAWLAIAGALTGCFATRPAGNLPFRRITGLKPLEGSYRNVGQGGKGWGTPRLSELIWSKGPVRHDRITAIEVLTAGDTSLIVKALEAGNVAAETTFVKGRDFVVRSGKVRVRSGWGNTLGPDSPMFGFTHGTVEFGLDTKGNGKYMNRGELVGLVYFVLPIIGHVSSQVRYARVP